MLLNGFFRAFTDFNDLIKEKLKDFYYNSNLYDKRISKTFNEKFHYKPSPYLLSSLINYQNKKYNIKEFDLVTIWEVTIKAIQEIK